MKKFIFNLMAVLLSGMVISCASQQEMSAEEEHLSGAPVASTSTTDVAAPQDSAVRETASMPTLNTDPGISESAPTEAPTEPTLIKPEEKPAASSTKEAVAPETAEALPLSGAMAQSEEKVNGPELISAAPSVDSSLDTSSLSPGNHAEVAATSSASSEPTLIMPTLGDSSMDTPKMAKRLKRGTKRPKPAPTPAPQVASARTGAPVVAQEVDTQVAKNVVANQVAVTEVDGVKLNRFYFLRPGDHTEKVSELLYGNRSMADKLVKWNGGVDHWVPGNRIVYPSPVEKTDNHFLSFYEEGRVAFKEYRVQKGDNLKTLAARFYGDIRCWSELAHVNSLPTASPMVSEGVVLKFAPERLVSTTVQAKSEPIKDDEVDAFAAADKAAQKVPIAQKEKTLASVGIGAFLMNNLFLIVTVTLVLGLIVFMLKSRDKDPMEF